MRFLRAHVDLVRQVEELHRAVRRLTCERDEALALVIALRDEVADGQVERCALHRLNRLLMAFCPSDLRELEVDDESAT